MSDHIDAFIDAVENAERQARETHDAGTCGESEWSCSYCEAEAR